MINKTILFFTLFLFSIVHSQTENKFRINDLPSKFNIRKIEQKKLKWTSDEIYGYYENGVLISIFGKALLKSEIVAKYFTKEDIDFVEKQYVTNDSLWEQNKKGYKVLDSLKISKIGDRSLKTHRM